MIELIAILLNMSIAARLTWFERGAKRYRKRFAWLASVMIGLSLSQAVSLAFIHRDASVFELIYSAVFAYLVWSADGNVARLWEYRA